MPEARSDTLGCPKTGKSAPNPLDPELLTAKERIEEVASLLARGFLRARLRGEARKEGPVPPAGLDGPLGRKSRKGDVSGSKPPDEAFRERSLWR